MEEARLTVRIEASGSAGTSTGGMPAPSGPPGGSEPPLPGVSAPQKMPAKSDKVGAPGTHELREILKNSLTTAGGIPGVEKAGQAADSLLNAVGGLQRSLASGTALGILAGTTAAAAGVAGLGAVTFAHATSEAGNFSADLASARAESSVRRITRQLSQADRFGNELAGIERARSRAEDSLAKFTAPYEEKGLQHIETIATAAAMALEWMNQNREIVDKVLWLLLSTSGLAGIAASLDELRKLLKIKDDEEKGNKLFNFKNEFLNLPEKYRGGEIINEAVTFDRPVLDMDFR